MTYYQDNHITQYCGDFRKNELPDESIQCVVTSPPYWGLRKYSGEQELIWGDNRCEHQWGKDNTKEMNYVQGNPEFARPHREYKNFVSTTNTCSLCGAWKGAYGLEPTPEMYIQHTIEILREIRRVLRKDGVVFWNIGDSYSGSGRGADGKYANPNLSADSLAVKPDWGISGLKPKDLCLIPFRVAIAAQEVGWWVRSVIIWSKPNPMPKSVTDRPTESHEYILMLTKSARYYWDADAVREDSRRPFETGSFGGEKGRNLVIPEDDPNYRSGSQQWGREYTTAAGRNIRSVWEFPTQPFSDWSSADYVGSDGKPYIASEDCPLHGQYHDWQKKQKELHDGQPNLGLPHITDIPSYLWSKPQSEPASIPAPDADQIEHANLSERIVESNHDHKTSEIEKAEIETSAHIEGTQTTPASNSDCSDQERSPTATERSKQNHRSISPIASHDKPSDEKASRIPDNSQEHAGSEPHHGKGESRTLGDFSQDGLFSQIPDHNFDIQRQPLATPDTNYKCSCKISQGSHFAVFPEKLPETCIKAATPEVGCCSKCGAPWQRILDKKPSAFNIRVRDAKAGRATPEEGYKATQEEIDNYPGNHPNPGYRQTTGWQPTCKCNAGKAPSIVLDPFAGAGTTLWVAKKLNRKAVGYEISQEYCDLALERNKQQVLI